MTEPGETIPIFENLKYPFDQASYCLNRIKKRDLKQLEHNAHLESFLLHVRNIADLFRGSRPKTDVTYNTFLNEAGITKYKESVNFKQLDNISKKISHYASHLSPNATKQQWNDVYDAFPLLMEYRSLLIGLIAKYPKS